MRSRYWACAFLATIFVISSPGVLSGAEITPGCSAATAADQARMVALGLPKAFQVCPDDEKYLGIRSDFDQWYAKLKAMSPCNKNTCNLACKTRNTGAQVCGKTASKWNSIGCHPNNNTAIFPTVAHGFAAHIELLRRYCSERGRCTISSVVQQWTAVARDRPAYAAFVSRASGIPANQVFNPNDMDVMARMALAKACFEGGALPFSVDDLKKGLAMASGGPKVPVPANVGELLNESLTGSYSGGSTFPGLSPLPGASSPVAYPNQAPSAQQLLSPAPAPAPVSASLPLPQPIASSDIFATSTPLGDSGDQTETQSKTVTDLLNALAAPKPSSNSTVVRSPLKLSESIGPSNAAHLTSPGASSTSQATSTPLNAPQSTNTFSSTYRSPDLRWSTPTFMQPFWRDVETMVRSLIDLLKRL